MKILVDMQGAQSGGSRNRGIGRYTQSLVKSLILNKREEEEIVLLFSSAFWECIPDILREMDVDLAPEQIKVWHCNAMVSTLDGRPAERDAAELSREAYIAMLAPDVVIVTSLFEGANDDVVVSVGKFLSGTPTGVVLYDLIPHLNRPIYLADVRMEHWYERRLQDLRSADVLLAISEASRQDGLNALGLPAEDIVTISSAVEGFSEQDIDVQTETSLRARYGIDGNYVLYTGGIDHRKNIEGLIEAFALLPRDLLTKTQLVVVCSITDTARERLIALAARCGLPANSLVLTGFVAEEDLVRLYNLCALFVFPSLYEGFGLPVLEAMRCGAVAVGANTSSIPEVIGFEEALFDPSDKKAITDKIVLGLTDERFRQAFRDHALEHVENFSWHKSGIRALAAMRNAFEAQTRPAPSLCHDDVQKKRLAYISPLPPMKSGIADFSAELLPELALLYDIDLVVNDNIDFAWANGASRTVSVEYFRRNVDQYDRVLYHFGNSDFHSHMFDLAMEVPGVVVLHDFFLSGIHHYMQVHWQRDNSLNDEVYLSHGYAGLNFLETTDIDEGVRRLPCNFSTLSNALAIVGHSKFHKSLGQHFYGDAVPPIWEHAPLARTLPRQFNRKEIRERLGLSDDELLICSFGVVAPTKLNHRLLKAWDRLRAAGSTNIHLVFVGEASGTYGAEMTKEMKGRRTNGTVKITGWTSQETYRDYLQAADIAVQLRGISRGETSASVLDCMAAGLPTVINANGSMAEIPSDCVLMLADDFSDDDLLEALQKIVKSAERRAELGRKGRKRIQEHHSPRQAAARYREIVEAAYASPTNIPHRLRRALDRHSSSLTKRGLLSIAQANARNFRPSAWQRQILVHLTGAESAELSDLLTSALKTFYKSHRLEPVENAEDGTLQYARSKTLALMGLKQTFVADEPADLYDTDIIFSDDLNSDIRKLMVTTPGLTVRPLGDLLEFLSTLEEVELG